MDNLEELLLPSFILLDNLLKFLKYYWSMIMGKFHLSDKGPAPCRATIKCPIGGDHFDTMEKAQAGYEKEMKHRTFGSVKRINHDVEVHGRALKVLSDYENNLNKLSNNDNSDLPPNEAAGVNSAYDYASASFDATVQTFERKSANLSSLDDYDGMLRDKITKNNEKIEGGGLDAGEVTSLKSENRVLGNLRGEVTELRQAALDAETNRLNEMPEVIDKPFNESKPELGARYSDDDGRIYEVEFMSDGGSATLHEVLPNGEVSAEKIFINNDGGDSENFTRVEDETDTPYKYEDLNEGDVKSISEHEALMENSIIAKHGAVENLSEAMTGRQMFRERAIKKAEKELGEAEHEVARLKNEYAGLLDNVAKKYSSGGKVNAKVVANEDGELKISVKYI